MHGIVTRDFTRTVSRNPAPRDVQRGVATVAPVAATADAAGSVVGTWSSADGFVRHVLFADGRYDESRGSRAGVYRGRYALHGARIDYLDDGGFFAYGEFIDGALHHGGMVLHRTAAPTGDAGDTPPREHRRMNGRKGPPRAGGAAMPATTPADGAAQS